jgi:hypothetical protein
VEYMNISNIDKETADVLTKSQQADQKALRKEAAENKAELIEFHRDLSLVSTDVRKISFNDENKAQGYSYTSAAKILQKVNEALAARGIAVVRSEAEVVSSTEVKSKSGTTGFNVVTMLKLTLGRGHHEVTYTGIGQGQDYGDKAAMKSYTAALKYALAGGLLIAWEKADPEADESTDAGETDPAVQKALDKVAGASYSDLQMMKPELLALRGKPGYTQLRDAYKARVAATKVD